MGIIIPISLQDLIHSYERLLTGIEASDEHDRHRPVKLALRQEITELRVLLIKTLIEQGMSEQEANQAATE